MVARSQHESLVRWLGNLTYAIFCEADRHFSPIPTAAGRMKAEISSWPERRTVRFQAMGTRRPAHSVEAGAVSGDVVEWRFRLG
jgi:hypothetical protein